MARPKSNPLKVVRKGDKSYYYHRTSGVSLGNDYKAAMAKAQEMEGHEQPARDLPPTVFSGLCDSYLKSGQYLDNRPKTRALNLIYVERLRRRLGNAEVAGLTPPVLFAFKEKLRAELRVAQAAAKAAETERVLNRLPLPKSPRMAKGEERAMSVTIARYMITVLSILMTHAIRIGVIRGQNPCSNLGGFNENNFRVHVWSLAHCEAFLKASTGPVQLAAAFLLFTAQRPSDCLAMTWDRVKEMPDGRIWVSLTQEKTGAMIDLPAHESLAAALRSIPRGTGLIAPAPNGGQWEYRNFARLWDSRKKAADFYLAKSLFRQGFGKEDVRQQLFAYKPLHRRDLRRTAMVSMALAGCTISQIASVSGHSTRTCQEIIDRYIPRRSEIAARSIERWQSAIRIGVPEFKENPKKPQKAKGSKDYEK